MKRRRAISPFIATVLLVAMTISLGGVLYTQFRDTVVSQIRNPSVSLVDVNVANDRRTVTLLVKNDGNVDFRVSSFGLAYGAANQNFVIGNNVSLISGDATMKPGSLLTARFKIVTTSLPSLASFTITIVADQLARAFNVEG
ncbi:MAG TPA: archaellin/type IV pilin N-terminal domain-containing protein [Nitrososphaerales archaeon]|nr:archaellin/type IV pilin N-terminal domain-containing protein [Nitrososphaerales archaeon]